MTADSEGGTTYRLTVDHAAGERLDVFLTLHVPDLSRSRAVQLLDDGSVLVNGRVEKKSYRPEPGDDIVVEMPAPVPSSVEAESIPLAIVHEDEDLLVIDKPAGLVVHPAPGHRTGTLVNALLHHVGDLSGIGGVLRPGIVHRLDKDTSGLLVVAKNDVTHRALSAALKRRDVHRIYTTAVWGHIGQDDLEVNQPIARSRGDRKRMSVQPTGRPARTRLHRLERWPAADLLRAELDTGRTHQIRVHLAWTGHPVVGDVTYGGDAVRGMSGPGRQWAAELDRRVTRQFLHASELRFTHPGTGQAMQFEAPLPPDLAAVTEWVASSALDG